LSDNNGLKEHFFLVPKALKNTNMDDADRMWRLDFHNVEMKILRGFPKSIIRLLKTFRNGNKEKMSGLSSYLLKTIVMLLVKKRSDLIWSEKIEILKIAKWLATTVSKMEESMGTINCRSVWRQQFGLEPIPDSEQQSDLDPIPDLRLRLGLEPIPDLRQGLGLEPIPDLRLRLGLEPIPHLLHGFDHELMLQLRRGFATLFSLLEN